MLGALARLFTAVRAAAYASGFVLLWAWVALLARDAGAGWFAALPGASRPVGAVLAVGGAALAAWCIAAFVLVGRGTPAPFDPPRVLVPVGPSRWVRNPMYLGGLSVLAGFGLWNRSIPMTLVVAPAAALVHLFVIWYEEPSLEHRFGEAYRAYRAAVRRWVPTPPGRG